MKKVILKIKQNRFFKLFFMYMLIVSIISTTVFVVENSSNASISSFFDAIWLSIITMTTTGYGDIVPVTLLGKIIIIFLVFSGIFLTALLTGTFTTAYINQISKERSGRMKISSLKDHLIICGWREQMIAFLLCILKEATFKTEDIVIIADVAQEQIDNVFDNSKLYGIKFIRGFGYDTGTLERANCKFAKKAMVLADYSVKGAGFDVDSYVVMTVIALKTVNKSIYVCAQLLENKFDTYLQKVACDEILYSKDLNTEILSKTVANDGMSNIMQEILGVAKSHCSLSIEKIKNRFISKNFKDIKNAFLQSHPRDILLGILENTGQKMDISEMAIREAQKTADFIQMISDLKRVKSIRPYNPVMLPSDDYVILKNSSVIILRKEYEQG